MGKRLPQERWNQHISERFTALKVSGELEKLRAKGLAILGRKKLLSSKEWWESFRDRTSSQKYLEWHNECKQIGDRFGLAPWTVELACLLKGFKPEESGLVMEAQWPRVRIVTENTDSLFLRWLSYEAQKLGLYVVQKVGSVETTLLYLEATPPTQQLTSQKPPRHVAFYIRCDIPIGYPPEARDLLNKQANQLYRELLTRLGYSIPKRLRNSSLVSMASDLRVAEAPLQKRGLYEIVAEMYEEGTIDQDKQRRKTIKTERHRVRKRLIKPYELEA